MVVLKDCLFVLAVVDNLAALVGLCGGLEVHKAARVFPVFKDIQMDNFYERFPTIIQDNPLSEDLQTQIYKIPSVEKIVLDGCVVGRLVESKVVYDSPEDNLETVNSLSPELVANASELVDGTINYDEIGLDGIVVNKYRTDRSDTNYGDLKIGDTLLFHTRQAFYPASCRV